MKKETTIQRSPILLCSVVSFDYHCQFREYDRVIEDQFHTILPPSITELDCHILRVFQYSITPHLLQQGRTQSIYLAVVINQSLTSINCPDIQVVKIHQQISRNGTAIQIGVIWITERLTLCQFHKSSQIESFTQLV